MSALQRDYCKHDHQHGLLSIKVPVFKDAEHQHFELENGQIQQQSLKYSVVDVVNLVHAPEYQLQSLVHKFSVELDRDSCQISLTQCAMFGWSLHQIRAS